MTPLLLGGLVKVGEKLIDHFFPDPNVAAEKKLELLKLQESGELARMANETLLAKAQIDVNLEEAKNPRLFVSGWRPAVGWVCGFAFAYAAVLEPMARFIAAVVFGYKGAFPVIDTALTIQILFGILGLGAMRMREKEKGVAAK